MTLEDRYEALGRSVSCREIASGRFRWLTDAMVRTDGARARLRVWGIDGCPDGPFDLCYVGDAALGRLANAVLQRIPAPVARHIAKTVLVVGICHQGGLFLTLPKLNQSDEARQLVVLNNVHGSIDDDQMMGVVAHEFAHSWTAEVREVGDVLPAAESRTYRDAVARVLRVADAATLRHLVHPAVQWEWRAATLACEWGFTGQATELRATHDGMVRQILEEHASQGESELAVAQAAAFALKGSG